MKYDVIIIGAGAAGLLAMRDLAKAGYHVCMLEAADIAGGRISAVKEPNATKKIFEPDSSLLQTALLSLSSIFRFPPAML